MWATLVQIIVITLIVLTDRNCLQLTFDGSVPSWENANSHEPGVWCRLYRSCQKMYLDCLGPGWLESCWCSLEFHLGVRRRKPLNAPSEGTQAKAFRCKCSIINHPYLPLYTKWAVDRRLEAGHWPDAPTTRPTPPKSAPSCPLLSLSAPLLTPPRHRGNALPIRLYYRLGSNAPPKFQQIIK